MIQDKKLYSPAIVKEIIQKHGFRFSKSLGQNFLIDKNIIDKICDGGAITKADGVIEVGPGIGTLTQALSERAERVLAVELDRKLIPILNETLSDYNNIEIIHGDILKTDIEALIESKMQGLNVKVVANLPYYITTPIIMRFLEGRYKINKIVVTIQKEVAERMKASPGTKDYGALSIAVQYYSEPVIETIVPRNVFMPKPNVDSAVIALNVYDEPKIQLKDEKLMFNVVKAAFGKRRKTLANALSTGGLGLSKEEVIGVLKSCNIDPGKRGERLSIEEFARIADGIYEKK